MVKKLKILIDNGLVLKNHSLEDLFDKLVKMKPKIKKYQQEKAKKIFYRNFIMTADYYKNSLKAQENKATLSIYDYFKSIEEDEYFFDFHLYNVTLIPKEGNIYCLYNGGVELLNELKSIGFEDFNYEKEPNCISEEEYHLREKIWSDIFNGSKDGEIGFIFNFTKRNIFSFSNLTNESIEDVAKNYFPTDHERKENIAKKMVFQGRFLNKWVGLNERNINNHEDFKREVKKYINKVKLFPLCEIKKR